MHVIAKTYFGLALSLGLAACATTPPVAPPPDPAVAQLAQAADEVTLALRTMASVEQARHPVVLTPPAPAGVLRTPMVLDWSGPIEALAREVGSRIGYRVTVIGSTPSVPVVVSIHTRGSSAYDILRDAGLQAGDQADVMLETRTRTIEIRYGANR